LSPRPDRAIGRLLRGLSTLRALTPYGLAAIGLVVLAFTVALWVLSADARREIDALATASADSSQWALAQAEEMLQPGQAVLGSASGHLVDGFGGNGQPRGVHLLLEAGEPVEGRPPRK